MLAHHPERRFVRYVLGELYTRTGRYRDAVEQFAALVTAGCDVATLYPVVAELYWRLGQHQEAADYLERAPAGRSEDFRFQYTLGMSHLKTGAYDRAITHLTKAADLMARGRGALSHSQGASFSEALAFCLFKAARFRESAGWYEKALAATPGVPELQRNVARALVRWADALLERREFSEAAAQLAKAEHLHPDADVRTHISHQLQTVREFIQRQGKPEGARET